MFFGNVILRIIDGVMEFLFEILWFIVDNWEVEGIRFFFFWIFDEMYCLGFLILIFDLLLMLRKVILFLKIFVKCFMYLYCEV